MISVVGLSKRFGCVTAIDNISFEVKAGEIVGFLGPNGAGKTTTMRILTGFLTATAGVVTVGGRDALRDSLEVRRRIGYLPENYPIYPEMRVSEYLRYRGRLKGLRGPKLRARVADVVETCGLTGMTRGVVGHLSRGYVQRLGLADSLIHEPELLILDEPTVGLDPNQIRNIRSLIKSLAQRHTVLLSSHILPEVEMICQRVLIMDKGRIVASDTRENLAARLKGGARVVAELKGPFDAIAEVLRTFPGVINVSCEADEPWGRFSCECEHGADIRENLFGVAAARNWSLRELTVERTHLEDVFFAVTADRPNAGAGGKAKKDGG
ncbi:MAG: ATP-binding cassette domain-containing protein [Verrucomicrobiota bacterium]|nr:ATP-binding cassette domain-containing protein [Verrucomicrobiota bacterium]